MKDKRKINYPLIVNILVTILVIVYSIYLVLYKRHTANFKLLVINDAVLLVISFLAILNQLRISSKKKEFNILNSLTVALFVILTFLTANNATTTVALTKKVPNFIGKNLIEALKWAKENNVTIDQIYEYSENYDEYIIFGQNVEAGIEAKDVKNITLTISDGVNYDKKVIIGSLVGQDIETLKETINSLHLNNVKIQYKTDEYTKKDLIISQSKSGEIRRNDEIIFTLSLGSKNELVAVKMENLIDKSLFDATLFLEQNGISYEIKYDFSDKKIDTIINQSVAEGTTLTPLKDNVIITVSKGKQIKVPNLKNMKMAEIVDWITANNLKISFSDKYDSKIAAGSTIEANYKENDIIEEGATIKIVTSKGPLKMRKFNSLTEFRTWANTYNIKYEEEYRFHDTISKGSIISYSLAENDLIDINDVIVVTISNGKAVTVPSFVGKTKNNILTECNKVGLSCSFTYSNYSSTPKDTAVDQNKKAGSSVVSGTSIIIYLSKGPAKTFKVEISESQLTLGDATKTIQTLTAYFASKYPGVTFTFSTRSSNIYSRAGFIHEASQVTDGTSVTQGKTYNVIITK